MDTEATLQPSYPGRKDIQYVLQRYQAVAGQRLQRIQASLSREQSHFFTLLPVLLHVNHPALPGYAGSEVPAGIAGYLPDRDSLLLARRYARSLKKEQRPQRQPPLLALYLIGSLGTLGHDRNSDFDFWLCHSRELDEAQVLALREKTRLLETYGRSLGLQMTFFHMVAEDFRDGRHCAISNESSGHTQHHLLLEEFYRSGLLLAGRPPLWWLVPPQHVGDYREYCRHLVEQRFVREQEWLDFGGLEDLSADEFFSAAHWQLYKSIELPYKALLKLMLFETYAVDFPRVRWLCDDVKVLMHSQQEIDADSVDAYRLLLRRVEAHLADSPERRDLARRAFYFKSGVRLSGAQGDNWKLQQVESLTREWRWNRGDLLNLDSHRAWKLNQVVEERNRLVAELSRSYRLLTELTHGGDPQRQAVARELALLGRKLYAALERRPGKVDLVNPGISDDLSEEVVWLRRGSDNASWHLHLQPPTADSVAVKSASNLVELLAWLQVNGVVGRHTRIDLPAEQRGPIADEYLRILHRLYRSLPPESGRKVPMSAFATPAAGRLSLVFVNTLHQVQAMDANLMVSDRSDPLSFGSARTNLVQRLDHLYSNTWGELQVDHYQGATGILDLLCSHLDLFRQRPQQATLECHCHTPGYAQSIVLRLSRLADELLQHFVQHGEEARYLLCIGEDFHLLQRRRGSFVHTPLGGNREMMEYLGEAGDGYRPTALDPLAMPDSPLAFILQHNRPGQVQIFYRAQRNGIDMWVLDQSGALFHQWLESAVENHFLNQQQRFFETLHAWRSPFLAEAGTNPLTFVRLQRQDGQWQVQNVLPPRNRIDAYTELVLGTGRRGPWQDGFSLVSGTREFNSLQLGERLYDKVADYLLRMRTPGTDYPIYLTGVVVADEAREVPVPLVELLRFKSLVERRLADAVKRLQAYT